VRARGEEERGPAGREKAAVGRCPLRCSSARPPVGYPCRGARASPASLLGLWSARPP